MAKFVRARRNMACLDLPSLLFNQIAKQREEDRAGIENNAREQGKNDELESMRSRLLSRG